MMYQFHLGENGQVLADLIMIHASQKLSTDWTGFMLYGGFLAILGFIINPALAIEEVLFLIGAGLHMYSNYNDIKEQQTPENAKAVLLATLISSGVAQLEGNPARLYITQDPNE